MIDNKKTLNEAKDKKVTSVDIDKTCRDLSAKATQLYEMLQQHPNNDADLLKRVKGIADYFVHILPIDAHLRKKRADKRKKMVDEDVTVSAQSPTNVQQAAKKLAGTDSNVVVTEKQTMRLKDVLSESVLNGFKKKIVESEDNNYTFTPVSNLDEIIEQIKKNAMDDDKNTPIIREIGSVGHSVVVIGATRNYTQKKWVYNGGLKNDRKDNFTTVQQVIDYAVKAYNEI